MSITYTRDIPDAPNNPSVDQGPMKVNTNSIDTIIAVDHFSFAGGGPPLNEPAGTHKFVRISSKNNPGAQTDPSSAVYTESGQALASTVAQLKFKNQNGVFALSAMRAWAVVTGGAGAPVILNSQSTNVASVARNGILVGRYIVTLTANAVSSASFGVIACQTIDTAGVGTQVGYIITGTGTFQLNFTRLDGTAFVDPAQFSFMVLQI